MCHSMALALGAGRCARPDRSRDRGPQASAPGHAHVHAAPHTHALRASHQRLDCGLQAEPRASMPQIKRAPLLGWVVRRRFYRLGRTAGVCVFNSHTGTSRAHLRKTENIPPTPHPGEKNALSTGTELGVGDSTCSPSAQRPARPEPRWLPAGSRPGCGGGERGAHTDEGAAEDERTDNGASN
jgi:hypothetical protein